MANYHIHVDGQSTGPFTEEQLREQIAAGQINDDTLVWVEGTPDWVALKEIKLEKPKIQLRRAEAIPPTATDAEPMQFEHAEFAKPAGMTVTCSGCKASITDVYYEVNGQIACSQCHDGLSAALTGGSGVMRFLRTLGAGVLAAAVGAGIWYAILKLLNMELGLIAIAVGLLVGFAVRWGSQGRGGWLYQTLAMVLTYCAIVSTYIPFILQAVREQRTAQESTVATNQLAASETDLKPAAEPTPEAEGPQRTVAGMIVGYTVLFALAFASPFLAGLSNIIGLIIIAIALYEAWKINKRAPVAINGPFRVGAPKPAA